MMKKKSLCDDCVHNDIDCIHFVNCKAEDVTDGIAVKCDEYEKKK